MTGSLSRTMLAGALLLGLTAATASAQPDIDWAEIREQAGKGRYEDVEKRLSDRWEPLALRWRIELAERKGERAEARQLAQRLLAGAGQTGRTEDLAQAAFAAWRLDMWHDSNQLFIQVAEQPDASLSAYVDWGNLYLQQYNAADAESIFLDALKVEQQRPTDRWGKADAYLGLARAIQAQHRPEAEGALEKAAELEPDHLDLLAHRAEEAIRESDWEEAKQLLERGLKRNRHYLPLLRLEAASHFFRNQEKEYGKLRDRIHSVNPKDADLYELLANLCVIRRRLDDAIAFFRAAIENNPRQWSALASLGINLLRVGEEEEGKAVLEKAYANDPFNIWTVNTLRLLDSFDRFTRFSTPHFEVKIESDEVAALRPYVEPLLEKSLRTIAEKYDHPIEGPYVFEMYSDHEDFAVRTLGLPGLGALGAAFGKVVAMDSPSARPGGRFHWGATLWHEVAHVVTLSLSRQKVPRWLTEGISMYEERLSSPGWGDPLSVAFVRAYSEDKLLAVADLDSGFQRPRYPGQLEISYYQAGWLSGFIAERYGVDKLRAMLVAFGEDKSQEEVFEDVLGMSEQEVDAEFRAEMKRVLDPLVPRLDAVEVKKLPEGKLELAAHFNLVAENPDNYLANLQLGRRLAAEDRHEEALEYLEKARQLFPDATADNSPYPLLAEIYRGRQEEDQLLRLLQQWWECAPRNADLGLELADRLLEAGRRAEAIPVLEGVMYVDPLRERPHRLLGDLYLEHEKPEKAAAEFRVALALGPDDPAGAHYRLARALFEQGQSDEARRQVLLALEIAPSYTEAQKLLLDLVRK